MRARELNRCTCCSRLEPLRISPLLPLIIRVLCTTFLSTYQSSALHPIAKKIHLRTKTPRRTTVRASRWVRLLFLSRRPCGCAVGALRSYFFTLSRLALCTEGLKDPKGALGGCFFPSGIDTSSHGRNTGCALRDRGFGCPRCASGW